MPKIQPKQVGIAGSVTTGNHVVMAGQAGVRDHVKIGSRTMVGGQSGVSADTGEDQVLFGSPAIPFNEQAIALASLKRLPEIRKSVKHLARQVEQLMNQSKPLE